MQRWYAHALRGGVNHQSSASSHEPALNPLERRRNTAGGVSKLEEFSMKQALVAALILSLGNVPASVWAQSKDECDGKVMAAIKMLQIRSAMTRTEQKHGDLSIADIEQLEKSKGSCFAAKEIDKRTQNGAKVSFF
jgi:hypothetical protein